MKKIINLSSASNFKKGNKKIVVAGGCFDILHIGHIKFLENAKKRGDILIILLESDESVKKLKGVNRPINTQKDRASILSAISFVDYIIMLPKNLKDKDYDNLITKIKPDVIAVTKGTNLIHNKRQAILVRAKISLVTERIKGKSTTNLLRLIS